MPASAIVKQRRYCIEPEEWLADSDLDCKRSDDSGGSDEERSIANQENDDSGKMDGDVGADVVDPSLSPSMSLLPNA